MSIRSSTSPLFTGAGRGELLNLSWPMVDLVGSAVVITGSSVVEGEGIVGTTKVAAGAR